MFKATLPQYVIPVAIIIIIAIVSNRLVRWMLNKHLAKMDRDAAEATGIKFLKNTTRFVVWLIAVTAIIFVIPRFRSVAVTLFAGAGLMVAIIGFAAQQAIGNIISGIFLVLSKPFRVGDLITVGKNDYRGRVTDITLRHVIIKDFQNKRIIIPNSIISAATVVNDSIFNQKICRFVEVGISYESDLDMAIQILRDECTKHPLLIDNRTPEEIENNEPLVDVRVMELGEYAVKLRAWAWTDGPDEAFNLNTDVNYSIKKRFQEAGIEIPYPHRTLVMKGNSDKSLPI
jgi:small conductance mechanosensitive channel